MDYREFLTHELKAAGQLSLQFFGKVSGVVKSNDSNQVLTEADMAIGAQLIEAIKKEYPGYNIIDEEAGVIDNGSRYTWVIDPIEATSNFAAGLPEYGIMVGLLDNAMPIAGGVIAPALDRLYLAEKGKGATRNGEPIHVTAEENLLNTLMAYGIDSHRDDSERTYEECRILADIVLSVRNMRNSGCEAIDPMYVAEGRYGGRINQTSKIWDNVAPQIIAEEAGALWTAPDGSPLDYSNPLTRAEQNFAYCTASPVLHSKLVAILRGNGI